jgi:hypothetical protein
MLEITFMEARNNYGPIRSGNRYKVIETGLDWVLISLNGKAVYIPDWVFEQ